MGLRATELARLARLHHPAIDRPRVTAALPERWGRRHALPRLRIALGGAPLQGPARGLEPIPQYAIAGRFLDLAIVEGEVRLDVEVDGDRWHRDADGRRKADDLWRGHQPQAPGWQALRFWIYELREDIDGCVDRVLGRLRPRAAG